MTHEQVIIKPKYRKTYRGKPCMVPYQRAAARAIGCSQGHVWGVVMGFRVSKRVSEGYNKFVAEAKAAEALEAQQTAAIAASQRN
jgi:hypothetical protein